MSIVRVFLADASARSGVFIASLLSSAGGFVASAAETMTGGSEAAGFTGVIVGICGAVLAVTGLVMNFLDKRRAAEASGNDLIISTQKETIKSLRDQLASERVASTENASFLRSQIDEAHRDILNTRQRAHDNLDRANRQLLQAEEEAATLRTLCVSNGIELPVFPSRAKQPPVFPAADKKSSQIIQP